MTIFVQFYKSKITSTGSYSCSQFPIREEPSPYFNYTFIRMDLTEIESFDFFFESIWKKPESVPAPDSKHSKHKQHSSQPPALSAIAELTPDKVRTNIVDTILFRNGKPYKWLFTSEKTGVRKFKNILIKNNVFFFKFMISS